jgi:hypothetical protein
VEPSYDVRDDVQNQEIRISDVANDPDASLSTTPKDAEAEGVQCRSNAKKRAQKYHIDAIGEMLLAECKDEETAADIRALRGRPVCSFHSQGKCKKGLYCPFFHVPECNAFKKGRCKKGDECLVRAIPT